MTTLTKGLNNRITRFLITAFSISLFITALRAQQPVATTQQPADDRIALYQALLDLTNPWTVMCVAAHPDDEDGTSLIVMRRKYGAHTVSLFSTFGEGGQNAIGPELYEELGAIRARETMAASEIQGSEPYFLGLKDFGFSKSREETFQKWGHEEALRRMVLQIRKLRPDVIITNHSTTSNDHGHHQATALLVVEAFDAAADPKRFPEQLKDGITTWQVQRLFVRQRGAAQNPDRQGGGPPIVTIDPNERDPVRGTVFAEQALSALQKHATQGPWPKTFAEFTARFRAFSGQGGATGQMPLIRYRLEREANGATALPKESHNFVDGLRLPESIANQVEPPTIEGRPLVEFIDQREKLVDVLIVKKRLESTSAEKEIDAFRSARMRLLLSRAISSAAGLEIAITPTMPVLAQGSTASFSITISNKGNLSPWVIASHANEGDFSTYDAERTFQIIDYRPYQIEPGKVDRLKRTFRVPTNEPITVPHSEHLYDGRLFQELAVMHVSLKINGVEVGLQTSTSFDVAPPVEIKTVSPSPLVVTPATVDSAQVFRVSLTSHRNEESTGQISISDRAGGGSARAFALKPYEQKEEGIAYSLGNLRNRFSKNSKLSFSIYDRKLRRNFAPSNVPVIYAEADVARGLRIGYIRGFDFSLPNALNALGVESKELSVDEVTTSDLSKYTSVIVDNRVYESHPELIGVNQKLLDYANAGGNLIVFYHKNDEWNPDPRRSRPQLAPYKLVLGNERITDENAPITFLEPDHPLLNSPNKLNQEDFKDWIQERGLYYPREWDQQFHPLLQSNDPNEQPLKGGLLVADYGRGHYIYTSMVWYRQLRAGVPGAYRMLANMISYGKN